MEKFGKEAPEILDRLGGEDAPDGKTRPQTTQGTEPGTNRKLPKASLVVDWYSFLSCSLGVVSLISSSRCRLH